MRQLEIYIEKHWGLLKVRIIKTLQERGARKVFLIMTLEGNYILKLFHPELSHNEIEKYTKVLVFLEETGVNYAPKLIRATDHTVYGQWENRYLYIMEYIHGTVLTETPENEYSLGKAVALLHKIKGYNSDSCIDTDERMRNMLTRFDEYHFKAEYDAILRALPNFKNLKQGFIHTDICPLNAMKRPNGEIVFIDFDDAGNGSVFIDIGYPLITQFIQFDNRVEGKAPPDIEKITFHYEAAKAFYDGYFSITPLNDEEKERIFDGAVFMQLMYMPEYGEEAVPFLWKELSYALENKSMIMKALGIKNT